MPSDSIEHPLLRLEGVSYRYPGATIGGEVLSNVSLSVQAGEIVRVSGRNGSGKTTLLKIAAGLLLPTAGRRDLAPGVDVAYLDQSAIAITAPALTVGEQLEVAAESRASVAGDRKARSSAGELATFHLGLEGRLDSFVAELSGGQRQIVALLSVLRRGAGLLLLDEFTTAMDPMTIEAAIRLVRGAAAGGVAIAFVDHRAGVGLDARPFEL